MVLLKRYPFTVTLRDYTLRVAGVELGIGDLARDEAVADLALRRFKANVEGVEYKPRAEATLDDEVFSFHLAVALASAVGPAALRRFSEAEASRTLNSVRHEDESTLLELAAGLGVRVEKRALSIPWLVGRKGEVRWRTLAYRVHVSDYLKIHAAGEADDALTNSFLLGGWVYLDRQGLEDLIGDAVKSRIEDLSRLYDTSDLPETLVAKARTLFEEALDKKSGRLAEFDPEAFPPCIKAIVDKSSREGVRSLSDTEGYMLATFLAYVKHDSDTLRRILNVSEGEALALSSLARFARIRGFKPFKCSAAREVGVCRWQCRGPTPLAEYRRRLASGTPRGGRGAAREA